MKHVSQLVVFLFSVPSALPGQFSPGVDVSDPVAVVAQSAAAEAGDALARVHSPPLGNQNKPCRCVSG